MTERRRQIEQLASQARELPPARRREWLDEQCGSDAELQREVEGLLAAEQAARTEFMATTPELELGPGAKLSHYEIRQALGKGAMGEVWLARDEVLDRSVAIKLPSRALLGDATTRRRLLREARAAAGLNHPAVCQVYEVGQADGQDFIVMEHVEGDTLEARLRRGRVSLEQRLQWAAAVAGALEAAHRQGIVHRDLKPANVMVTPREAVKVMDFGLARRLPESGQPGQGDEAGTAELTTPGMIVGTPRYMAPEQIKGEAVTAAADIWAFGCILYQVLSGRPAFEGSSSTETLGAVLEREVNFTRLPDRIPREVRLLVERCLRKDPHARLQHIGDARLVLEDAIARGDQLAAAGAARAGGPGWARAAGIALLTLFIGGVLGFVLVGAEEVEPAGDAPIRFTLATENLNWGAALDDNLAAHPDGRAWVFRARDAETDQLWLRSLERDEPRAIPGTEGGSNPFWSPDGRYLGFVASGTIRRVEPFSGSPRTVTRVPAGGVAGTPSWGRDGTILFADYRSKAPGVYRVAADGGEPALALAREQIEAAMILAWPAHLPGSDRFVVFAGGAEGRYQLYVADPGSGDVVPVPDVRSRAEVLAPGLLVFEQEGALLAQPFDLESAELGGDPVMLADSVVRNPPTGAVAFSASPDLLVTTDHLEWSRVQWFDRSGAPLEQVGEEGDISQAVLSPDGNRVLLSTAENPGGVEDLWVFDLEREIANPLTTTPWLEYMAVWSPDGSRVAYSSDAFGPPDIRIRDAQRGGELTTLVGGPSATYPLDWSPDGDTIIYWTFAERDLWLAPVDGSEPQPWLRAEGLQTYAQFAPDGRWVAFRSTELGSAEIFVAPVGDAERRRRVSVEGGYYPAWGTSSERLYFASRRAVFVADIDPDTGNPSGRPERLFTIERPGRIRGLDISQDGERFLLVILDEEQLEPRTKVQIDWQSALRKGRDRP